MIFTPHTNLMIAYYRRCWKIKRVFWDIDALLYIWHKRRSAAAGWRQIRLMWRVMQRVKLRKDEIWIARNSPRN